MPATHRKHSRKKSHTTIVPNNFSLIDSFTWHLATVPQLYLLSAESLHLHLTARNLVSTGNKSVMAQRLYDSIHLTQPDHSSGSSANPESSPMQSNQPTVTNNTTSGTTNATASDQQVSLGIQLQQLQPQHLANLLLQAALRLSATLPSSSKMAAHPKWQLIQYGSPTDINTSTSSSSQCTYNNGITTGYGVTQCSGKVISVRRPTFQSFCLCFSNSAIRTSHQS